jgi:hypothetical protein
MALLIGSIICNAVIGTVVVFGILEFRRTRELLVKNQSYIRRLKYRITETEQEIQNKEALVLKEKIKGNWTIQFFHEEQIDKGLFRTDYVIRYRFQLLHNGFPVGPAGIVKEETFKEIDKDQVNQVLKDFAKPMLDAGLNVAIKSLSA